MSAWLSFVWVSSSHTVIFDDTKSPRKTKNKQLVCAILVGKQLFVIVFFLEASNGQMSPQALIQLKTVLTYILFLFSPAFLVKRTLFFLLHYFDFFDSGWSTFLIACYTLFFIVETTKDSLFFNKNHPCYQLLINVLPKSLRNKQTHHWRKEREKILK